MNVPLRNGSNTTKLLFSMLEKNFPDPREDCYATLTPRCFLWNIKICWSTQNVLAGTIKNILQLIWYQKRQKEIVRNNPHHTLNWRFSYQGCTPDPFDKFKITNYFNRCRLVITLQKNVDITRTTEAILIKSSNGRWVSQEWDLSVGL